MTTGDGDDDASETKSKYSNGQKGCKLMAFWQWICAEVLFGVFAPVCCT